MVRIVSAMFVFFETKAGAYIGETNWVILVLILHGCVCSMIVVVITQLVELKTLQH